MAPSDLQRSTHWAGLRPGDPVVVSGTRMRSASWSFVAQVSNVETGETWVEVVGGRSGDRAVRRVVTRRWPTNPGCRWSELVDRVAVHAGQDAQHDLVRPGADGVETGVAVEARGPVLGHVADAPVELHGGVGHLALEP
jgi:hypothetical protein